MPIVFWNRDQSEGDVMLYHLSLGQPGDGSGNDWDWSTNEWGYTLVRQDDGTMGHPVVPPWADWPATDRLARPPCARPSGWPACRHSSSARGDRYRLACST